MAFEIRQGDCLELARQLPDCSLEAIVQDPPAGIHLLHRDWDSDKGGRDAWIEWLTAVMREGFRALKPGGFAICWALPRTSHWTAMALENSGFRVVSVISHLRSTGFPKGLDIAKSIDKSGKLTPRGDSIYHVTAFVAAARDSAGMTNLQIDQAFGHNGMAGHWTSQKSQPAVPTWENWEKLKDLLKFDDSMDDEILRLNGRKGQPGDEWFNRPILGWAAGLDHGHVFAAHGAKPSYRAEFAITGNATDAANEWEGWNTAIRPNAEFWIVARKTGEFADTYGAVIAELDRLEDELCKRTAPFAGSNTPPTEHGPSEERGSHVLPLVPTKSETVPAPTTPTGGEEGGFGRTVMLSPGLTEWNALSIVSSWRTCLDGLWNSANKFTTETVSGLTTALKIFRSCLCQITHDLPQGRTGPGERWSAFASVADAVLCVMLQQLERGGDTSVPGSAENAPASEHFIIAQRPLSERNYANNVLKWGVGAFNIDACRVSRDVPDRWISCFEPTGETIRVAETAGYLGEAGFRIRAMGADEIQERCGDKGRWPSNVVLSHNPGCGTECTEGCAVAELDRQSGATGDRRAMMSEESVEYLNGFLGQLGTRKPGERGHNDSGGASRYFNTFAYGPEDWPAFLYQPGASRSEKEAGCAEAGIEPTVLNRVNSGGLEEGELAAWLECVRFVEKSFMYVQSLLEMEEVSIVPTRVTGPSLPCTEKTTPTGGEEDTLFQTVMSTSGREAVSSSLSTAMSWNNTLGALWEETSMFTMSMGTSRTTELKTLSSCLQTTTPESIILDLSTRLGEGRCGSNVRDVVRLFDGLSVGLGSEGTSAVEIAERNHKEIQSRLRWEPKKVCNNHPTSKSISLMRWLCRLVCRKGGTIADFFCGSGTTACAAVLEGMDFVGFEKDPAYVAISQARAAYWQHQAQQSPEPPDGPPCARTAPPAASKGGPVRGARVGQRRKPVLSLTLDLFVDEEEVTV